MIVNLISRTIFESNFATEPGEFINYAVISGEKVPAKAGGQGQHVTRLFPAPGLVSQPEESRIEIEDGDIFWENYLLV